MTNTLQRLDQSRLNVTTKYRANPLAWRGQFTPQLVDYLIESFAEPSDLIVDPFAGSGTVLLESAIHGMPCVGNELNPAAFLMSKFFHLVNSDRLARQVTLDRVREALDRLVGRYADLPLMNLADGHQNKYANLVALAREALPAASCDPMTLCVMANVLFKTESSKVSSLNQAIWRSFDYIADFARDLPFTSSTVDAQLGDARSIHHSLNDDVGLVVTSPPYINVFNYHQNHRALVELLDLDLLRVARSEIGSNRKNRGNRFRTVIQYGLDMSESLDSVSQVLRPDGILVLVVGRESNVRGIPFYNGKIIKDLLRLHPCYTRLGHYERHFINRFGLKIREDILVTKRSDEAMQGVDQDEVRKVVGRHLRAARKLAAGDVSQDLESAIDVVQSFPSSDLYTIAENPIERSTAA